MKNILLITLVFSTLEALAQSAPPHLDPEMTSREYQIHLRSNPMLDASLAPPSVERAIVLGERLSNWIQKINERRSPSTAIRLTSAESRHSYPIHAPNIYSPEIIERDTRVILQNFPQEMRTVIEGSGELPSEISISDRLFIQHARLLDKNYQSGARYKSLDYYRSTYTSYAGRDVRGFYFLATNNITAENLKDAASIPANLKEPIRVALMGLCENAGAPTFSSCEKKVDEAFRKNTLADQYSRTYPAAVEIWNEFFRIPGGARRRDVTWSGNIMTVPFNTPTIQRFIAYLQGNIEDEFRYKAWALRLNFGNFYNGPTLTFVPNVVPHVNQLGGNQIVMDSNQPIEEYESQWVIRHEFGHVLGLPDCYHEFYDKKLKAYVNYQLDTTDLMCSRAGNMNERIFNELAKAYRK